MTNQTNTPGPDWDTLLYKLVDRIRCGAGLARHLADLVQHLVEWAKEFSRLVGAGPQPAT
ncbi:hypothetical protein [Kitasatospora sp. NPDC091207]|uniref:hypothetical protein n=1 Tax=Kitasatospora sp. NPDC091207 TaxID=3364083 RepID=UPI00381F939B